MNFITLLKKFTTRTTTNRKDFIKKIKRNKIHEKYGPNPNELFPNPNIKSLCYIKNAVKTRI